MGTMVRAGVLVEIRPVAPIWEHCGILSKVKVVATPGVAIGPITTHIHVLVVAEALSNWTSLGSGISWSLVVLWMLDRHHLAFSPESRILLYAHWFVHFALNEFAKSNSGWCLQVTLRWIFVEFHEMPSMALPLVDISPSLQEGQFLLLPCHWTLEYKQDSYLRFLETWYFEGMRPFVSRL
eukprot:Gb_04538 [translate_table: standard]